MTETYVLRTINGARLPAAISNDVARTVEVVASTMTLLPDRTFRGRTAYRETVRGSRPGTREEHATGTYERSGHVLRLDNAEIGTRTELQVRRDTLEYLSPLGSTWVFQRAPRDGGEASGTSEGP